jgi:LysM repeat protein
MSAMTAMAVRPVTTGSTAMRSRRPVPVTARPVTRATSTGASSTQRLRLTARGRFVLLLALALLVVGVSLLLGARGAQADGPVPAHEVERHVVATGETLWAIASSIATPDQDVRDVVSQLVQLNGLPSSALTAGQTIVVPVSG